MAFGGKRMESGLILCWIAFVTITMSAPNNAMARERYNGVDVFIPNDKMIEYDYQNGVVVYRFYDEIVEEFGPCYARQIEPEETYILRKRADSDDTGEVTEWRATTRKLPDSMISESVSMMCMNIDVFWLEEEIGDASSVCTRFRMVLKCTDTEFVSCQSLKVCVEWFEDFSAELGDLDNDMYETF